MNSQTEKEQAISATDFWNLAGRAGRLGKDFEGNVFLIDHARWRADPLAGPREQELASAVEETIVTRGNDFLQFVRNQEHPSGREPAFENTFVKLVGSCCVSGSYLTSNSIKEGSKAFPRLPTL